MLHLLQNGRITVQQWHKGHEKCISDTPPNEKKCVLSIKESNEKILSMLENMHIIKWPNGILLVLLVFEQCMYDLIFQSSHTPSLQSSPQYSVEENFVIARLKWDYQPSSAFKVKSQTPILIIFENVASGILARFPPQIATVNSGLQCLQGKW